MRADCAAMPVRAEDVRGGEVFVTDATRARRNLLMR